MTYYMSSGTLNPTHSLTLVVYSVDAVLCWMWPAVRCVLQGLLSTFVMNVWENCRLRCQCLSSMKVLSKALVTGWMQTQKSVSSQMHICLGYILSTFQEVKFLCLYEILRDLDSNLPCGVFTIV